MSENQLPSGWALAELERVLDYEQPTKYIVDSTSYSDKYPVPVLTAGKTFIIGYTNEADGVFDNGLPVIIFDDFTTSTQYVNFKFKVKSSAMKILLPHSLEVNLKYLFYLMQTIHIKSDTHKRYWISQYSKIKIPYAPITEQQRIVDKIEELFSDLDNGIESLQKVKQLLKTYRQAVLKDAFDGKLTEQWRKTSKSKVIAIDSVSRELVKSMSPLPADWNYVYLSKLGDLGRGKSRHRPRNDQKLFEDGKYPFIQTGEVKAAKRYIDSCEKLYSEFGLQQSKLWPVGTLCITIAANIAETAFLSIEACFPDSIVGFTANDQIVEAEYIEYFIQSAKLKLWAFAPATAQKNINLTTLENLVVPYCSLEEQKEVINEIESRFSICDKIEQTVDEGLQKAESLRQSILKKAFDGKLVPHDPNDEPAQELLKRIKEQKHARK